jgi:hypothetical protein
MPNYQLDDTELLFQHEGFHCPSLGSDRSMVVQNLKATAITSYILKEKVALESCEHGYLILENVLDILKADHANYFIMSKTDIFRDIMQSIGGLSSRLRVFLTANR